MDTREEISRLVRESEDVEFTGYFFCSEEEQRAVFFSDIMDVVFLFLGMQEDIEEVGEMSCVEFYSLVERCWWKWIDQHRMSIWRLTRDAREPWEDVSSPPWKFDVSPAKKYFFLSLRLNSFKSIAQFLSSGIEARTRKYVLPKWRREKNFDFFPQVLDLAEIIYRTMRIKKDTGMLIFI